MLRFDYKPLPCPFHFQRKMGDPSGVYHVFRVSGGRPAGWLGTIRRVEAGWLGCTATDRPRLGPCPSRRAAAEALITDRQVIAAENLAARPDIFRRPSR